jgi:hypothetical protein
MKTRKRETTRLREGGLGATEDRVGDRTGPGAGYDLPRKETDARRNAAQPGKPKARRGRP